MRQEIKKGDLVRWSQQEIYAQSRWGALSRGLTGDRNCGIIVDRNPKYFFVLWQNGDFLAQKPNQIEVIK